MNPLPIHRHQIEKILGTAPQEEPDKSPGHEEIPVDIREDSESKNGSSATLAWGVRTDVGLVRSHNEDSFLVQPPVFAVCDGMGGHAAGEVASAIAVKTIGEEAPLTADDVLLGAAVETANTAIIKGVAEGKGKPGMGCTASCILIEKNRMAIAHVGDSRIYLLHKGTLVRLTHDHSYVEELVDAGEITADEARVHPSRSVITRALGSDPDMYADHFTLDVTAGDRIIICSDGLSGMVDDSTIEGIACSNVTPQAAADSLTSAALAGGGSDNVTVIVIDVKDDGTLEKHRQARKRRARLVSIVAAIILAVLIGGIALVINSSWYLHDNNGTVAIYHGVNGYFMNIPLSRLEECSSVQVDDLANTIQDDLRSSDGVRVDSEEKAHETVEMYRAQIDKDKSSAAETADKSTEGTEISPENPAAPDETQAQNGTSE